jgi:hypothetical protein
MFLGRLEWQELIHHLALILRNPSPQQRAEVAESSRRTASGFNPVGEPA